MTRNGTGLNRRRRGSFGSGAKGAKKSLMMGKRPRCVTVQPARNWRGGSADFRSARTVSPAMAFWPKPTSGRADSGR